MQKQKFLKLLLIFPALSLLTLAKPANALFGIDIAGALTSAIASLFAWLANMISEFLFGQLLNPILNLVKEDSNVLLNHDIAQSVWIGALTVANGLFLLALVLASVAIILRLNTGMYNLKKILGGFIMAVILSNLSLLIVRVLVEFGDNLYIAAFSLFNSIDSRLTYDTVNGPDGFISALTKIKAPTASGGVGGDTHLGAVLLAIVIMILIFWILLKLTLILLERMFWIFLLAISAPIIFALSLLPTTQKLAADWWNKLIKWILVLPLVAVILNIAIYFLILTAEDPDNPSATINPAEFVSKLTETKFFEDLLSGGKGIFLIVGLIILYQAGRANNLLGIGQGGPSGAVDTPKKMAGTAKGVTKTATKIAAPIGRAGKASLAGATRSIKSGKSFGGGKIGKFLQKKSVGHSAWRKRQVGTMGMIVNPKGRAEILDIDIKNAEARELVGQTANRLSSMHRNLNTATQKQYGKNWDNMTLEEQDNAKRETPKIKKIAEQDKSLRGALMYHARNIAHQTKPEDLDTPEEYDRTLKNPRSTKGERTVAAIQLKRIASRKTNEGYDEAKAVLDDSSNIATLKNDGLPTSNIPSGKKSSDTTTSTTATVSMISYMQAGQKIKKLEKLLNSLGANDVGALQMAQTYHSMKHDTPEDKAKAKEVLRETLSRLGIKDKKEQDVIIDTAKSPAVGKALRDSTRNNPLNERAATTTTRLDATIEILSGAQKSANISAQVKATHKSTITNAQKIIVDQVNSGAISKENVSTINSNTQAALDKLMQAVGDDPDIKDSSKLSSLNLSEEVLKDIQNSFNNSGLVTGQNLDKISQISNASINNIIGHLDTVNQATAKK